MHGHLTLVSVTGAVPGLGKTTLARRLAEDLHAALFLEHEIGADPAFAEVMAMYTRENVVALDVLLDGTRRFVDARAGTGTHVVDALLPHLTSLLAWRYDDDAITAFFADLHDLLQCAGARLVQLHLEGDVDAALDRAAAREGDGWLDWMVRKYGVADVDDLRRAFADHARRSRTLLARAPWTVLFVDSPR